MHLLLIFLNILVLFGDETFGASLSDDYGKWKQNFVAKFKTDSEYIEQEMYKVADDKAESVANTDSDYDDDETKAAIAIVNLYTQEPDKKHKHLRIYKKVNEQLRNPSHCNGNVWLEFAKLLHRGIIILCPNDPKNCIYKKVYRGAKQCDEVANCDHLKDPQIILKGFTSTSTNADRAYRFLIGPNDARDGYFFCIINTKGLSVEKFSAIPTESEVLIPANTEFKISEKLESSNSNSKINERLQAHGVSYVKPGEKNADGYVKLEGVHTTMYGSYAVLVCKCGLPFPNLSLVMVIVVMVKVVL